jgi:hypothetical protein
LRCSLRKRSGSDKSIIVKSLRRLTLELALEYIEEDELVKVTERDSAEDEFIEAQQSQTVCASGAVITRAKTLK